MTGNATEKKLINLIIEHYINDGGKKLRISDIATKAGISRQAFNRYYSHLKPYVTGKKPIEDIYTGSNSNTSDLFSKTQQRNRKLQDEIDQLKETHKKQLHELERSYITSLMNNDITLLESNEIRILLEKQSLHNDKLLRQIKELQIELTQEKVKPIAAENRTIQSDEPDGEIVAIDIDLDLVFQTYNKTKDLDELDDAKDAAIDNALTRINKLCQSQNSKVILFIDRYLSSFKNFVNTYRCKESGAHIIVMLPLFTRTELKIFLAKLSHKRPVSVHIPYCDSKAAVKAQRGFLFRHIPAPELEQADKFYIPSMSDGFQEVAVFRIMQGD